MQPHAVTFSIYLYPTQAFITVQRISFQIDNLPFGNRFEIIPSWYARDEVVC